MIRLLIIILGIRYEDAFDDPNDLDYRGGSLPAISTEFVLILLSVTIVSSILMFLSLKIKHKAIGRIIYLLFATIFIVSIFVLGPTLVLYIIQSDFKS